jgi:O-antigen/teichoic acid export membrane protein
VAGTAGEPASPEQVAIEAAEESDLLDTPHAGPAAIRGSVIRATGYSLGLLLSLVSAPLLIRHLGQADFGRYFTVVSLIAIVAGVTEGGLNTIALREYTTSTGADRDRLMANLLGMRLSSSVLGGLLALTFAIAAGYDGVLVAGTALAAVGMVMQVTQTMLVAPLQSSLRFGWATAIDLLRQVITVAAIVALVLLGAGLLPFLATPIPACLIALAVTVALVRHLTPLRPRFVFAEWRPLVADTFAYAAAIALNAVYFRISVVLMSLLATAVQTGYFSTSFRVVEVVIGLPALIMASAFPILARSAHEDPERFRFTAGRLFEVGVLLGCWFVVCLEVGAPLAIKILGGPAAEPAIPVLRIQALAVLATFITLSCGFPMLALRRHRELLVANVAALAASAALTVALVPAFEARGAAAAAVTAETVLAAVTAVLLVRSGAAVRLPVSSLAVGLVAGVGALAAGLLLPVPDVLGIVLAAVVYPLALLAMGRFPTEFRDGLRGFEARLRTR